MGHLVQAAIGGVSIVAAMRPGESPLADELVRSLRHDGVADVVAVDPLDARNVADLISALLDARPPDELVADIVGRTDGVPLLVEEVVLAHVHAGTVEVRDGTTVWRDGRATVPEDDPRARRGATQALDPEHRNVVVAGAVVGDFDPALMVAVAEADDAAVSDALAAGVRAGLLETSGGLIAFRHAIIREAVLDATVPHLVDTMHRRAAAALDCDDAADARRLERRAVHLRAVGATDEAALVLVDARLGARRRATRHCLRSTPRGAHVGWPRRQLPASAQPTRSRNLWRRKDVGGRRSSSTLRRPPSTARSCLARNGWRRVPSRWAGPSSRKRSSNGWRRQGELSLPMRVTSGRAALVAR